MKGKGMKYLPERISPDYERQQQAIRVACAELGVVPFYPDYHGTAGDKNTVLVYLPEDEEYNRMLDRKPFVDSNDYRKPFWMFENSDINGIGSYEFANFGRLDLRGHDAKVIRGSIRLAYFKRMQNDYIRFSGGILAIREDETYNDLNRQIIEAFVEMTDGRAFIGKVNDSNGGEILKKPEPPFFNFCCDFIVPVKDSELEENIRNFRETASGVEKISERIKRLYGLDIVWF